MGLVTRMHIFILVQTDCRERAPMARHGEKINQINFFKLSSVYPPNEREFLPDLPNKNILIKEYGLRKFITDNHSSPAQLKELEQMIESKFKMIINYQSK